MRKQLGAAPSATTDATTKTYVDTGFQPLDSDLTTLAGLTATTDNLIQSVGSAWASRTLAQVKPGLLSSRYAFYHNDDFASGSTTSALIGQLGWALTAATVTQQTPTAGRVGVIRMAGVASAGSVAATSPTATGGAPSFLASELFDMTFIVKLVDNDSDTQARIGCAGSATGDPSSNGIFFEKLYADTSWFGVTRSGGTQTRTAAIASTSTNWCVMRVRRIDASTVGFTFDGGTEVTATANIPVTPGLQPVVQGKTQVATSKSIDIDYYELLITGLSR